MTHPLIEALNYAFDYSLRTAESGINLRENAHIKLSHEAQEYTDEPGDLEEAADVIICLTWAIAERGYSLQDLAEAVNAKIKICETRTWYKKADGTYQHTPGTR